VPGKGRRRSRMRGTAPMSFAVMTARTPRYRKRGAGIDRGDEAVRNRAAQDGRMQHALAPQIANELAAAAQKAWILDPLDRAADIPVRPNHGLSLFR
jgi:hypothetical protein